MVLIFLLLLGTRAPLRAETSPEALTSWKNYEKGVDEAWQYYVSGDYDKARPVFQSLADMGHPIGQFLMGNLFYYGQGVPMDKKKAREYFTLSARQGYMRAYLPLAEMLAAGEGGSVDMEEAYSWYNIAIAAMPEGKIRLQMIARRNGLGESLTPMQMADAQKKSVAFIPKKNSPPEYQP